MKCLELHGHLGRGATTLTSTWIERRNADRVSARRYLLGELAELGRAVVEERLFEDDAFFETFLLEEEDLVDAYVRGELSHLDRARFERLLAGSHSLAARVAFARDLLGGPAPVPPGSGSGSDSTS
jgi:hypothetical protein